MKLTFNEQHVNALEMVAERRSESHTERIFNPIIMELLLCEKGPMCTYIIMIASPPG